MESKAARVLCPIGNRDGPSGLSFEYSSLRRIYIMEILKLVGLIMCCLWLVIGIIDEVRQ